MSLGKIVTIAAGLAIVAAVAMNWADLKRYIKIESM
jgi:hypothetical protein